MLDRLLLLNLRTYLLDDLLPKVDRMAMAHALEVRSPFLDTQLLELAFAMPSSLKIRGFSLKRVLKAAMSDALPAQVLHRRKRGFGLPLGRWFRDELRCYLESRLLPGTARVRSYLRQEAIDQMVAEHLSGAVDHSQALWALVTLEEFLRKESW
jgi:asparagine synthase (glutamine-hydrolysing)